MEIQKNPTTKRNFYEQQIPVNFRSFSVSECLNKRLHPLSSDNSIESYKKNKKTFRLKTIANGYIIKTDIPIVLKRE